MNLNAPLRQLHEADRRLAEVQRRLREVADALADQRVVQEAEAAYQAAQEAAHRAHQAFRAAEETVEEVRGKLRTVEETLYNGSVRNPKELQSLQQEAEALRRRLDALEEQALLALEAWEAAEAQRQEAEQALQQARSTKATQDARLRAEEEDLQRKQQDLQELRNLALAQLPSEAVATYERLRERKGGQAVALVQEGACSACGAMLTSARLQAVRQGAALTFCDACGRILAT